ncbi:PRC-barrel domain-containing protein [Streptomyces sp. NBC_01233]|uniref:PRC-barrel domain-containing protein n=1 Tax=Streptomyces sp. NBC_01233 TaxID=2903787 RepID=UPI002E0E6450|nr:PRC-barrel domain-containing protein [Streptomyces sp. NBC_01233]
MTEEAFWAYHPTAGHQTGLDLVGYKVEATDGSIGKVDKHSDAVDAAHLVVDTGVWIFGRHVLLPAGIIQRIDTAEKKVYVNRTKDQIKHAPEFDEIKYTGEPTYLDQYSRYYGHM